MRGECRVENAGTSKVQSPRSGCAIHDRAQLPRNASIFLRCSAFGVRRSMFPIPRWKWGRIGRNASQAMVVSDALTLDFGHWALDSSVRLRDEGRVSRAVSRASRLPIPNPEPAGHPLGPRLSTFDTRPLRTALRCPSLAAFESASVAAALLGESFGSARPHRTS